jgi:hypothetical protein
VKITEVSIAPPDKALDHGGVHIMPNPMFLLHEVREDLQVTPLIHTQLSTWALQNLAHIWALGPPAKYVEKWAIQLLLATIGLIKPTRLPAQI